MKIEKETERKMNLHKADEISVSSRNGDFLSQKKSEGFKGELSEKREVSATGNRAVNLAKVSAARGVRKIRDETIDENLKEDVKRTEAAAYTVAAVSGKVKETKHSAPAVSSHSIDEIKKKSELVFFEVPSKHSRTKEKQKEKVRRRKRDTSGQNGQKSKKRKVEAAGTSVKARNPFEEHKYGLRYKITRGIKEEINDFKISRADDLSNIRKSDFSISKKGESVQGNDAKKQSSSKAGSKGVSLKEKIKYSFKVMKEEGFFKHRKNRAKGALYEHSSGIVLMIVCFVLLSIFVGSGLISNLVGMMGSPYSIVLPAPDSKKGEVEHPEMYSMAAEKRQDILDEAKKLAKDHDGYDKGKVEYPGTEGTGVKSNVKDIVVIYAILNGVGNYAPEMTEANAAKMQSAAELLVQYDTRVDIEEIKDKNGNVTKTKTILVVEVNIRTYTEVFSECGFDEEQTEMAHLLMQMIDGQYVDSPTDTDYNGNTQNALSEKEKEKLLSGISDETKKQACSFALSKVGYPYSQTYRDSGDYYDCSSLVYYAYKSAGVNISYGGSNVAAAECQGFDVAGKGKNFKSVDNLKPGDLIFWSFCENGRYLNITHVAIYVGYGKIVEAKDESYGVVLSDLYSVDNIVRIGRY